MDNENIDRIVNSVINGVTQVGQAAGAIYSSFKGNANSSNTANVTNYAVSSQDERNHFWSTWFSNYWPYLAVGFGGFILLFNLFKR